MCGILGCLNSSKAYSENEINLFLSKIAHRGPDESGFLQKDQIFMANTRLNIRGGESGKQPVTSKSKQSVLVYNGEIYNSAELANKYRLPMTKSELSSDSKFLVEFLQKFGTTKLSELDGAFAFVWLNLVTLDVIGARDRYGQKPLYYSQDSEGSLFFGSEIAPIKAMSGLQKNMIDQESILEYLIFQNLFTEKTFFSGIKHVIPGEFFSYNLKSKILTLDSYWKLTYAPMQNFVPDVKDILEAGIYSQVRDQNRIATLLSSGVDSTALTIISKKFGLEQYNITSDYYGEPDHEYNETKMVEQFALKENLILRKVKIGLNEFYENALRVIEYLEEPKVGQSVLNYLVFSEASKYSKVVLSGCGADEIFGGYPWRYPIEIYGGSVHPMKIDIVDFISSTQFKVLPPEKIAALTGNSLDFIIDFQRSRIRDVIKRVTVDVEDSWTNVYIALGFDFLTFLPGLLQVDDRLSMKNSVEVRTPFLANQIVDFALSIHPKNFFAVGKTGVVGKVPLRKYLEMNGNAEVAQRKKIGFSSPDADWFSEKISNLVSDSISARPVVVNTGLDQTVLNHLILEHIKSKNLRGWCWSYLNILSVLSQ
jgi:asparagine synthase (glutamine-hydrolysing)